MVAPKVVFSWLAVFCYASVIFFFSAVPGEDIPGVLWGYDKILHLVEYAILGFLLMRAISVSGVRQRIPALLSTVFVIMLYALSDEVHQMFVPGRSADVMDCVFDVLGGSLGGYLTRWPK